MQAVIAGFVLAALFVGGAYAVGLGYLKEQEVRPYFAFGGSPGHPTEWIVAVPGRVPGKGLVVCFGDGSQDMRHAQRNLLRPLAAAGWMAALPNAGARVDASSIARAPDWAAWIRDWSQTQRILAPEARMHGLGFNAGSRMAAAAAWILPGGMKSLTLIGASSRVLPEDWKSSEQNFSILLLHGEFNHLVPLEEGGRLRAILEKQSLEVEWVELAGHSHYFSRAEWAGLVDRVAGFLESASGRAE